MKRAVLLVAALSLHCVAVARESYAASYYVDCAGSDTGAGTSVTAAWKSLSKANAAPLKAGDFLLFKRGCTWSGRLTAKWNGTTAAPVTVGAYGSGNVPVIQADSTLNSSRVEVSGSYQVIENLDVKTVNAKTDPGCKNQTIGYFVGFNLVGSSNHNTIRNSKISYHTIGVHITDNSHHNKILNNEIFMNSVMNQLTPDSSPDLGAWGIDLRGDDNEIAGNYFHDNNGWCAYDFSVKPGNSIEIYNGDRNVIHHNKIVNDRVFSEVGHDGTHTSDDNVWAYNSYFSTTGTSRFLTLHGAGNAFGPVLRSKIYNNTIYLPVSSSTGIGGGDSGSIVKNNIIVAGTYDTNTAGYTQSNNIFWSISGSPNVKAMGSGDRKIDPQFVNPSAGDLHLKLGSPAIDGGVNPNIGMTTDLDGNTLPNGAYDIGAYEYGSTPGTATPTPTAITPSPSQSPIPTPTGSASCALHGRGDANCDGMIDLVDFEMWRREYTTKTGTSSDFNNDGGVTLVDFELWRMNALR